MGTRTSTRTTMIMTAMIMITTTLLLAGCGGGPDSATPDAGPSQSGPAAPDSSPAAPDSSAPSSGSPKIGPTDKPWGQHSWPGGLAVTVLGGQECVPSGNARPEGIERAVLITIRATNTTAKPYQLGMPKLVAGAEVDGAETKEVADFAGPCESNVIDFQGLGPKKQQDVTIAFAIPEAGGTLTFEIWPSMEEDAYPVSVEL